MLQLPLHDGLFYILVVGFCSDNNYRLTNMKIFRTKYQATDGLFDVDVDADAGGDGDVWSRRWRLFACPCLLALQAGLAYFAKNKRTQSTDGHWVGETNKRRRPHSNVKHEFHVCHSIRKKYTERKLDSCRNQKTIWISHLCSKSCQKCSVFFYKINVLTLVKCTFKFVITFKGRHYTERKLTVNCLE